MGTSRRHLVAGNWKMNKVQADGLDLARAVAAQLGDNAAIDVLICPPATLLLPIAAILQGSAVKLGAQDCHHAPAGAFTGDLSAAMIADVGCSHVILGHSERRTYHHESNELVRAKAEAAIAAGLIPVICVGETEAQRDAGDAYITVETQLRRSIPTGIKNEIVIAYEPIWAIGTGRTASPQDVEKMHRHIRQVVRVVVAGGSEMRLLYGGSVKPNNAAELMSIEDVDGTLVGGASLVAEEFAAIIDASGAARP